MPKSIDWHLHRLMWSGREFTAKELYSHTGEKWGVDPMDYKEFRRILSKHPAYGCQWDKDHRVWRWKVVHIVLPAPVEIRKRIKAWLTRILTKLSWSIGIKE